MNIDRFKRLEEFFDAAVALPPEQRHAYLDQACGDDTDLLALVERMLQRIGDDTGLLRAEVTGESGTLDMPTPGDVAPTLSPGDRVGRYVIREAIGEGGFAVVYAADQTTPVQRRVALKIIKIGMDTRQVIARFEAERQALAMMDHPCVAKVFDAGATETGRPYFVMEFVAGTPITDYCDRHRLSIDQRLRLFIQVCEAVQHAHQKAIIHRDIKPSNVLVEVKDGQPLVKVIDFGVAKAISHRLTEKTIYTEQGQLIGTPEYMSPEQAEMTAENIDTRSDIYSLGVLLYEMLTGALPLDPTTLRQAAFGEIQRIIREQEPPRPSTRLSSLGDQSVTSAERRRADPRSLLRELRGDLDWITMKALEKDRSRRYDTANGMALDIRRHLDHEPVLAGPPGATYKLRKFVRRNRAGVAAGMVVAVGLLVATAVSVGFALSEAQQRRIATTERDIAQAVNDFLNDDLLAAVAPSAEKGKGKDVLMRDVLDEAAKRIEDASAVGGRFEDKPIVEAAIRLTLGATYQKLGEYLVAESHFDRARELRRRVLGKEHPDTLKSMGNLAFLYWNQGRYDDAERLGLDTLQIQKRVLGEEHPDTLKSMSNLALMYLRQGRYYKAAELGQETLAIQSRVLGEEHLDTLRAMNNLALVYSGQGRYDKAESLYRKTLKIRKRVLGEEHPETLSTMGNLALLYWNQGRYDDAERLGLETLQIHKRFLGEEHPDTLKSMTNLALVYWNQGRYDKAAELGLETLQICKRVLGEVHPDTLTTTNNLAGVYSDLGRNDLAEPLFQKTLEIRTRVLGEEHPETLFSMMNLADARYKQGHFDEAWSLQNQAVTISRHVWPEGSWFTGAFLGQSGQTLIKLERYEDAEVALVEAHETLTAARGSDFDRTISVTESLTDLYDAWGKPDKAAEWRAKLPTEEDAVASDPPADEKQEE